MPQDFGAFSAARDAAPRLTRAAASAMPSPMTPRAHVVPLVALVACSSSQAPPAAAPRADVVAPDASADAPPDVAPDAASPDDLAAVLEPLRARYGLPALAAAVLDERSVIARGAVGRRDADDPTPVGLDDRWHLGSCTKAMTATLFARLVERGAIRWEATLAEAFPDLAATMDPAYRAVTMEQVMQHRAGLPGEIPSAIWSRLWAPGDVVAQRRDFAAAMLTRAPSSPPGTRYEYANAGYMIVGAALERVTGRPWEELVRAEVFAPLAMTSCGFGAPATPGEVDQPWGHRAADGGVEPVEPGPGADNPPALGPAGTVHCALSDWGRFAQAHLRGARGEATGYLTAESFARMHTPPAGGDYALGWGVVTRPWAGGTALTHQGSNTTFLATVWIAVPRGRALLVATNVAGDGASQATEATLGALIRAYLPSGG